jgi:transposase
MKLGGTILCELRRPVEDPALIYKRLRVLRRSAAIALNVTMQELQPAVVRKLAALWLSEDAGDADAEIASARNKLAKNWKHVLERLQAQNKEPDAEQVYFPVTDALVGETSDNIGSRLTGEHWKALCALKASLPSFGDSVSFYCEGRKCDVSGEPNEARIRLPLWGSGKRTTEFIVAPKGGSARATWRQLVTHLERRDEIVAAEAELKKIRKTDGELAAEKKLKELKRAATSKEARREVEVQIQALIKASKRRRDELREPLEKKLYGLVKMGRVGVSWNERKRKWFIGVSYTRYVPEIETKGQKAAVNFGIDVFIQALAEDGTPHNVPGDQILAKRLAYQHIRRRIQENIRSFGRGSRGRGSNRRARPIKYRGDGEARWVRTYNGQMASDLISWCKRHGIADLYVENTTDIREEFENATEGDAHPEVKRRIHNWPHYALRQAIEREGLERAVRVHVKSARHVSDRCPACGHIDPENIQKVDRPSIPLIVNGLLYRRIDKNSRFECKKCSVRGASDVIACWNHLQDVGVTFLGGHPLLKMQERAKTAISNDKRKKIRRSA